MNFVHKFASNQQVISGVTNFLRVDRKGREGDKFPGFKRPPNPTTRTFQIIQDTMPLDWFNSVHVIELVGSNGFTAISIPRSYIYIFLFFFLTRETLATTNHAPRNVFLGKLNSARALLQLLDWIILGRILVLEICNWIAGST